MLRRKPLQLEALASQDLFLLEARVTRKVLLEALLEVQVTQKVFLEVLEPRVTQKIFLKALLEARVTRKVFIKIPVSQVSIEAKQVLKQVQRIERELIKTKRKVLT